MYCSADITNPKFLHADEDDAEENDIDNEDTAVITIPMTFFLQKTDEPTKH